MSMSPDRRFLPWALALVFLAGCSSSSLSRIDSNRAEYESWPIEVQEAVLNQRAVKGMTPEMVTMAMGKPSTVEMRGGKNGEEEVWIYKKGSGLGGMPPIDVGTGTSIGGVGVYTSKTIGGGGSMVRDQDEVVFSNGVVARTDVGAR